jgi:ADP-ribosylglycohydrolase
MSTVIAAVAARGLDLGSPEGLDAIAAGFLYWLRNGASDVGAQTRTVLGSAARYFDERARAGLPVGYGMLSATMARTASEFHARSGRSGGNGSLMRTAPVALACLGSSPEVMAATARKVSELTHTDPIAGDACAIWCEMIRQAVLTRKASITEAIYRAVPAERTAQWEAWLAPGAPLAAKGNNGYVVTALQDALAACRPLIRAATNGKPPGEVAYLAGPALQAAVRTGGDTDTVAAIAGALIGALAGLDGLPKAYVSALNGWTYTARHDKAGAAWLSSTGAGIARSATA